jgi:hypothetical protein
MHIIIMFKIVRCQHCAKLFFYFRYLCMHSILVKINICMWDVHSYLRVRQCSRVVSKVCSKFCDPMVGWLTCSKFMFYSSLFSYLSIVHFQHGNQSLIIFWKRKICVAWYSCSFKSFECLFFLVLFYSQSWHLLLMFKVLKNLMKIVFIHGKWT